METNKIIFIVGIIVIAGVRLYMKYVKKSDQGKNTGSSFSSSSKDDDYEPYSKNK